MDVHPKEKNISAAISSTFSIYRRREIADPLEGWLTLVVKMWLVHIQRGSTGPKTTSTAPAFSDRFRVRFISCAWTSAEGWGVEDRDTRPGKQTVCYWKWPFMVDLPINSMVIFHSYGTVDQRVFDMVWKLKIRRYPENRNGVIRRGAEGVNEPWKVDKTFFNQK